MTSENQFAALSAEIADFIRRCSTTSIALGEADREFNRLALGLFRLQFDSVPVYRRFCEGRNRTPDTVARWLDIPALPVAAFKTDDVSSLPAARRIREFHSSGTTSDLRGKHYHNAASFALYEASLLPWFRRHLLPDDGPPAPKFHFLSLTPPGSLAPNSSLVHMFETAGRALPWASIHFAATPDSDGGWRLDRPVIEALLASACHRNEPVIILGPAFSFVHLLEAVQEHDGAFSLPANSRALETGGYKGRSREVPKTELRAWMSSGLGLDEAQIVGEYGMSELGSQAYDRIAGQGASATASPGFRFPSWARPRIISPETGREASPDSPGLIAILDLANVRSCLALQTEDLGQIGADGLQLLGRAARSEPKGCSLMPA